MKHWKKVVLIATIAILVPLWYGSVALAANVSAGVDLWETRPGDATHEFGGGPECPPIPADFFGPGSDPFEGQVAFQGQPLQTIPAGILGLTDTIVERLEEAVLPQCPSSDTIELEIIALNLVSVEPITVTYDGGMTTEFWDLQMCLSSDASQQTGSMTINQDCDDGGTFSAQIPVTPRFTFTKVGDPAEKRVLDYGSEGMSPISYDITDGHWLYSDPGFSVITSPGGLLVDHDCDGTSDVAVGPSSNFYPGLRAIPCNDCPGQTPTYHIVRTLWQSLACGFHGVYPPLEQAQPTIEPQIATECPEIQTECPAIETVCPEWGDTYCPVRETVCPKFETFCANHWTYCPEEPTWCPLFFTECPMEPTFCPIASTICELTQCEYIPTFCPEDPTWCPISGEFTICPYNYTWCPANNPTFCPMDWTYCPEIPTVCPEIITECPQQPTVCQVTVCPEIATQCPEIQTQCPEIQTSCPEVETKCPVIETTCPEIQTECPLRTTHCPVVDTTCPEVPVETECPTGQTYCPWDPTSCPVFDFDMDTVLDSCDNCPDDFNPGQEDNYPPGGNSSPPTANCGDACECEGNFDGDTDVDGTDAFKFKSDFGRRNCITLPPCNGDFNCDGDVDGSDAFYFKQDFGRRDCPECVFSCPYWP